MPRISAFYGIVIAMYFADHPPPHFHAMYGENQAQVVIATGEIRARNIGRSHRQSQRWWLSVLGLRVGVHQQLRATRQRLHYGIDMMAPTGTPTLAVMSGSVSYVPNGGGGGNEAYLSAADGNVYYYAHLSQLVGGARSVAQGEVIGLVGSTESSTAPHLHFEKRIGDANGQRVNPYSILQSAGC